MIDELDDLYDLKKEIDFALSYSRISDFSRNGPKALILKTPIDSYGVKIGSLVDDLISGVDFDKNYIVFNGSKPTATLGKLVDIILKNYVNIPSKEEILNIINTNKYWTSTKDEDKLIEKFDNKYFWEYLDLMINHKDKTVVTIDDKLLAQDLVHTLKTHKFSKYIFETDCEILYQVKFKFKLKGFTLRGIIDIVIIDHENKTVRFIDLKTGGNKAEEFMISFLKYGYYLQEAVYTKAFKNVCKNLKLEKYKLLPFQFLYIGRNEKIPLVHTISNKWHRAASKGFTTLYGTKYKGLNELLDDIKWHFNNRVFDLPRSIYENEGEVLLNDSFIKI